jgi:glutaredoxin
LEPGEKKYMHIVPVMIFVREGCPFCSKLMEELGRKGCDFCALNIDNEANIDYLTRLNMLVKAPPLVQTPNNFYVLHHFFLDYNLANFNEAFIDRIIQDMLYICN